MSDFVGSVGTLQFSEDVYDRLIEDLDSVYPPLSPSPNDSMAAVMYAAGQRSVVEYLIQQRENVLSSKL